jgi:arginine decarboxylase
MRAAAERLFWTVAHGIHRRDLAEGPEDELSGLADLLSDIYYCNFSVFQSMPDSWAIDQVFPICPIHRLTEEPDNKAVMADVTCDSDGVIDLFSGPDGYALKHLDVHKLRYRADGSQEPYYLGIFLVGAYQEVLGDLHNLFGDTNVVHVNLEADGTWSLDEVVEGDTVKEVLEYVQFDPGKLRRAVRLEAERAVKGGRLSVQESASLMRFYESGLDGYTYLE